MKVKIDQSKCIGCGACVAISKKNFDFNDDGLSTVIDDSVYDTTYNAVDACPVYAISIEEDEKDINDKKCKCNQNNESTCGCGHCTCNEDEKEAA